MSDIKKTRRPRRPVGGEAAARALTWLERRLRGRHPGQEGALPTELEIARAAGVGRSSVREALTALKVLGIVESRRKGGLRLLREPVLLELRHYFGGRFDTRGQHADVMEFRAALEWGLGPLMLARCRAGTIRRMREAVASVAARPPAWDTINAAEVRFHTALTEGCGNRLATLFAQLYQPLFAVYGAKPPTAVTVRQWVRQHRAMADALAARDEARFLAALRAHTHGYMRLGNKGNVRRKG
jgi:GntR family transcriptional repressor for pyruvate dehydrogenase complex